MEEVKIQREEDVFIIGKSPQLVVNVEDRPNYILTDTRKILFHKEISLSPDLIRRERKNVLRTTLTFYYHQACAIVEGYELAAFRRKEANP